MTPTQKIERRQREIRERLVEISRLDGDAYGDDQKAEERGLQDELVGLDQRMESAKIAEAAEEAERRKEAANAGTDHLDAETRERVELRSKASLTAFLTAHASGRLVQGAEAELQAAAGDVAGIPIELWDVPERRAEERVITGAPGTVGVNLDPIRPAVFASSIAPRLGIEMPRVGSGTFASATISTSQTAAAKAAGDAIAATAGGFTVATATPKRVSARLELRLEDIAAVGQTNFEAALRQNLAMALSDALDDQAINGNGTEPNLTGLLARLDDPTTTPTAVADFDAFVGVFADGIDGLWAATVKEIGIVAGVDTYKLSAKTFRDIATADLGATSFADYAMQHFGGWWTNKRMPAAASNIQAGILYRKGRPGMRTAVCPHWGEVGIDDLYTGSAMAERYFTLHVLLGDVIVVQPGAYAQIAAKVA